jgi:integron integrase
MSEAIPHPAPKLLDRVSTEVRTRHYSRRTEEAYLGWIRRFILFHRKRHPNDMGSVEIAAFLSHLAVVGRVSASTQNQALCALLFLYKDVLKKPFEDLKDLVHAKRPVRVPVVLTRDEVRAVLAQLHGTSWLVAAILYGGGLRLLECLALRVKDIDLERRQIVLRRAKGQKDRRTVLAESVLPRLIEHLADVRRTHERDLTRGYGSAPLPEALERKYPNAAKEWKWQGVVRLGSRQILLAGNTNWVEEKVLELQQNKRALADAIVRADASLVRTLDAADLELLLS